MGSVLQNGGERGLLRVIDSPSRPPFSERLGCGAKVFFTMLSLLAGALLRWNKILVPRNPTSQETVVRRENLWAEGESSPAAAAVLPAFSCRLSSLPLSLWGTLRGLTHSLFSCNVSAPSPLKMEQLCHARLALEVVSFLG